MINNGDGVLTPGDDKPAIGIGLMLRVVFVQAITELMNIDSDDRVACHVKSAVTAQYIHSDIKFLGLTRLGRAVQQIVEQLRVHRRSAQRTAGDNTVSGLLRGFLIAAGLWMR